MMIYLKGIFSIITEDKLKKAPILEIDSKLKPLETYKSSDIFLSFLSTIILYFIFYLRYFLNSQFMPI